MTPEQLHDYMLEAQEALRSFFLTISDEATPLEVGETQEMSASPDDALSEHLVVYDAEVGFAVALEEGWVELISQAMLGEAMSADDAGAEDLMSEIAAQAYGVVRTALAGEGLRLPESTLGVSLPGDVVPPLEGSLLRASFAMPGETPDQALTGFAIFPAPPDEPASPQQAAPQQQAPQQKAAASGGSASGHAAPRQGGGAPGGGAAPQQQVDVAPASFADLGAENIGGSGGDGAPSNFDLLAEVEMEVTVELGRRRLPLADVLRLTAGSVIELEKLVGEPLEVYANGRLIAEGEAVVIDEQFGIRITSLAASKRQREKAFF